MISEFLFLVETKVSSNAQELHRGQYITSDIPQKKEKVQFKTILYFNEPTLKYEIMYLGYN